MKKVSTKHEIVIGTRTFRILFPELLRPLNKQERQSLRKSIEQHGILVQIVLDEDDGVIDGGHRLRLAHDLGLPESDLPLDVRTGLTLDQKQDLARSLNLDRRHLTQEEMHAARQQRIARVVKGRRDGKSYGVLAEEEGVSRKQIKRDLDDAGVAPATPDTITGMDGKRYQRSLRPTQAQADAAAANEGTQPSRDDVRQSAEPGLPAPLMLTQEATGEPSPSLIVEAKSPTQPQALASQPADASVAVLVSLLSTVQLLFRQMQSVGGLEHAVQNIVAEIKVRPREHRETFALQQETLAYLGYLVKQQLAADLGLYEDKRQKKFVLLRALHTVMLSAVEVWELVYPDQTEDSRRKVNELANDMADIFQLAGRQEHADRVRGAQGLDALIGATLADDQPSIRHAIDEHVNGGDSDEAVKERRQIIEQVLRGEPCPDEHRSWVDRAVADVCNRLRTSCA